MSSQNGAALNQASSSSQSLEMELDQQASKVRQLKLDKAPKDVIDEQVKALKAIKEKLSALGIATGATTAGTGSKNGNAKAEAEGADKTPVKFTLKTPKGTRDWDPLSMALRNKIFKTITDVFTKHGAVTIDTPVFELKEILAGKYGEDSKLIYDLQDQGGELCSLRYDLTVPFARYIAMNPSENQGLKRMAISKVYRRDQPVLSKGRFREFYQCDFDIAGQYDAMIPDAEILLITVETLKALEMGAFTVKINHRKILDGIFDICGVPSAKTRAISSAVDKLDKSPWEEVKREMVAEKGLDEKVADDIGTYVMRKGGRDLLDYLKSDERMSKHKTASEGLQDMDLLFDYLEVYGITQYTSFDLSLARGLDYYTGIIYEAITAASAPPGFVNGDKSNGLVADADSPVVPKKPEDEEVDDSKVGVGSIAGGGRYDHLVGMFTNSKKPDAVPCVGISIGVERVFALKMAQLKEQQQKGEKSKVRSKDVDVFVMSMGGNGFLKERMMIAKKFWDAGVKVSTTPIFAGDPFYDAYCLYYCRQNIYTRISQSYQHSSLPSTRMESHLLS